MERKPRTRGRGRAAATDGPRRRKKRADSIEEAQIDGPRLKVIIRRLPPNLPEHIFVNAIKPFLGNPIYETIEYELPKPKAEEAITSDQQGDGPAADANTPGVDNRASDTKVEPIQASTTEVSDDTENHASTSPQDQNDASEAKETSKEPKASTTTLHRLTRVNRFVNEAAARITIDWFAYIQGRLAKDASKAEKPSRAYLHFTDQQTLVDFHKAFDGHLFVDSKGKGSYALVEFAPYQRIPRKDFKPDPKQDTIEQDPRFQAFVESLENADRPKTAASGTNDIERMEHSLATTMANLSLQKEAEKPKTTPLLEHLRAKAAAKGSGKKRTKPAKVKAAKAITKDQVDSAVNAARKADRDAIRAKNKANHAQTEAAKLMERAQGLSEEVAKMAQEISTPIVGQRVSHEAQSTLAERQATAEKAMKRAQREMAFADRAQIAAAKAADKAAKSTGKADAIVEKAGAATSLPDDSQTSSTAPVTRKSKHQKKHTDKGKGQSQPVKAILRRDDENVVVKLPTSLTTASAESQIPATTLASPSQPKVATDRSPASAPSFMSATAAEFVMTAPLPSTAVIQPPPPAQPNSARDGGRGRGGSSRGGRGYRGRGESRPPRGRGRGRGDAG